MTLSDPNSTENLKDRLIQLAHGFEFCVIVTLFGAIAAIVIVALIRLGTGLYNVATVPGLLMEIHSVQRLFGMVMTVLIAMEIGNSIMRHVREHEVIIQVQEIILISMMAVVRKIMLVDLSQDDPVTVVWLGVATFVLAGAYWLMGHRHSK